MPLLKPKACFFIFLSPSRDGSWGASWAQGSETGTGRVRVPLVTILLFGGSGYAHLRLLSPLAFDHRFRSPFRPRGIRPAGERGPLSPYNIERLGDDSYQISLAVAGFSPEEISITAEQNVVTIEGTRSEKTEREWAGPLPTGRECLKQQHEQARPPRRMHYHNARVVPVIDNRARGMHGGGSSQRARGRHIAA